MQKFRVFYDNNKRWFYHLQYIIFSVFLLVLTMLTDLRIIGLKDYLPDFMLIRVDLSSSILISLAAAFLSITTFTFSTILVVLNMYASSFTPRVVENFINTKITMKVLGIYVGGFFYCVSALLYVREVYIEEAVISGFTAIVYSIVCIFYFVKFVQEVAFKFQSVNLIYEIADEAKTVVETEIAERKRASDFIFRETAGTEEIRSVESGYLGAVDSEKLLDLLTKCRGNCEIRVQIGSYISEDTVLALVQARDKEALPELLLKIGSCFILQDRKLSFTDYRYNLTKLSEIALRAISPGINDPNTAIHCINKLGTLFLVLARTDSYHIVKGEREEARILYTSFSFEEDLTDFLLPLVNYGKTDLQVILAILQVLYIIGSTATAKNRKAAEKIVRHIREKTEFTTTLEKSLLSEALRKAGDRTEEES